MQAHSPYTINCNWDHQIGMKPIQNSVWEAHHLSTNCKFIHHITHSSHTTYFWIHYIVTSLYHLFSLNVIYICSWNSLLHIFHFLTVLSPLLKMLRQYPCEVGTCAREPVAFVWPCLAIFLGIQFGFTCRHIIIMTSLHALCRPPHNLIWSTWVNDHDSFCHQFHHNERLETVTGKDSKQSCSPRWQAGWPRPIPVTQSHQQTNLLSGYITHSYKYTFCQSNAFHFFQSNKTVHGNAECARLLRNSSTNVLQKSLTKTGKL